MACRGRQEIVTLKKRGKRVYASKVKTVSIMLFKECIFFIIFIALLTIAIFTVGKRKEINSGIQALLVNLK